jgi:hypothetical protein
MAPSHFNFGQGDLNQNFFMEYARIPPLVSPLQTTNKSQAPKIGHG